MKNLIVVLGLFCLVSFTTNAQSKECCSKDKGDITKVEKCKQNDQTNKVCNKVETTTETSLNDDKETVKKEVVVVKTKMDGKEKCGKDASCCDMKKTKMKKEVKEEVEKKLTN